MLLGMAVLLLAADATIYTVQRRQLYRAFDETLLNSANSLTLLIHPGPFGNWFDTEGMARLPAGRIQQGALFQFWSDQPIDIMPSRPEPDSAQEEAGPMGPPQGGGPPQDGGPPPEPLFPGRPAPPDQPFLRPPSEDMELRRGPTRAELIIRSPLLNDADLPRLEAVPGSPRFENIRLPDGRPGRAVGVQVMLASLPPMFRRLPPTRLTTVVAAGTVDIEKQLSFLAVLLAVTAFGTMAVAGGVAWLVVSRGLRPLAKVARKMAAMDETGLKERITDQGMPREIEPVVNQLNGMLGRLDEAFDRERALTADVAHELRTPVAEIRTITEITLSRQRSPDEYRAALSETQDAVKTLQGLIEKLLVLARLEAGQMKPELDVIALHPTLIHHWEQVRGTAGPRGIALEDRCPADTMISADPKLLEVVLSNVLSNAAAYTPDAGRITAEVRRMGSGCRLSIANTGCELGEGDVARVFDRFWRADAARSKSGLNCGLGLSLVRRAMEAMGGKAEAGLSRDRCFVLTLTFANAAADDMNVPDNDRDGPQSSPHMA
jgi:two-component system, OmpR family, heavy metal sensor histidine kinase CusS